MTRRSYMGAVSEAWKTRIAGSECPKTLRCNHGVCIRAQTRSRLVPEEAAGRNFSYSSPTMVFPFSKSEKWHTGYCGCFEDWKSCLCGCFCPCVLVGRIVEIIDQGATSCRAGCMLFCCLQTCTGCGCLYTCGYRSRLRQKFGLPAQPCPDFFADCLCPCCSLTQQYRELKHRGYEPSRGYEGNKGVKLPQLQIMKK